MTPEELLAKERALNERLLKAYFELVGQYTELYASVQQAVPVFNGHMNTLREALEHPEAVIAARQ